MAERDTRERDILVASNEYAYVQDLTKGDIVLYVGPTKISLSNTERLVELRGGRFVPVRAEDGTLGVSSFCQATSAQYIVLENPPKDPTTRATKGPNSAIELLVGRKVVVPGPASFPLWPGQRAEVVDGHLLCEDEYLVVRVYDAIPNDPRPIGHQSVVRGTDTSFFVPTTGVEVVPRALGREGTAWVRKAHRLRKGFGVHVRVLKTFDALEGEQLPAGKHTAGSDVFLVDREGYFFPTENVEIVTEIAPVPIAEREGLYVREIATGAITTIEGPANYLPDPTKVAVVGPARTVYVPSGFAVLVTAKNRRQVVRGPTTRVLGHEEELETLRLSTGKPKTSDKRIETAMLQVDGNKVSDIVRVKTRDHNDLEVMLSYRVSFVTKENQPERWFNVEDYVGLLCDHLGSLVRGAARQVSLEQMHEGGVEIVRTAVLGERKEGAARPGRAFEENGMWVYDVEVLELRILDPQVKDLLEKAQRNGILADVARREEALRLETERTREEVERGVLASKLETIRARVGVEDAKRALAAAEVASRVAVDREERLGMSKNEADALLAISAARQDVAEKDADLARRVGEAKVAAFEKQMAALAPELVATLKTLGHQQLAAELSKNVAPLAILGGESVGDVVERLIGSLPVGANGAVRDALPPRKRA